MLEFPGERILRKATCLFLPLLALSVFAQNVKQDVKRPPITGVAHISLFVHDIGQSRHFYKDFLGYDEPFKLDKPDGRPGLKPGVNDD